MSSAYLENCSSDLLHTWRVDFWGIKEVQCRCVKLFGWAVLEKYIKTHLIPNNVDLLLLLLLTVESMSGYTDSATLSATVTHIVVGGGITFVVLMTWKKFKRLKLCYWTVNETLHVWSRHVTKIYKNTSKTTLLLLLLLSQARFEQFIWSTSAQLKIIVFRYSACEVFRERQ